MGAAGGEQARDGALLALARNRGDSTGEKRLITFHVAAKPRVLVEARAGLCIGKIAPDGGFLEPVEHLLGLRLGKQDFASVANLDDTIGDKGIASFGGRRCGASTGTERPAELRVGTGRVGAG